MDDAIAVTGLVVGLASLLISFFAVWLSMSLYRQTSDATNQFLAQLAELKGIIRLIQHDLPNNIASLVNLRDTIFSFSRLPIHARERIHSLDYVAIQERKATREIWILAVTMEYELDSVFQNVIVSNIVAGKKYTYFIPSDIRGGVEDSVNNLMESLKSVGLSDGDLTKNITIYKVSDANLLVNITLHDPFIGQKCGFILPVYSDKEGAFQVTLDDDLHDRMRSRMQDWIRTAPRIFPLSECTKGGAS